MATEEVTHLGGILAGAVHAQLQRFEAAQKHPGGVRVADGANGVAHHPHLIDQPLLADDAASNEIAVPADIFGEAVDAEVRALRERLGPQGTEEGVVDRDRRFVVRAERRVARRCDRFDVDQHVGRISWAFEIDQADAAH